MAASFTVREIVPSSYIRCASEIIRSRKSLWRALGVNTSTETPGRFLSRYLISPMSKIDVCGVVSTSMSRSLCSVSSQEGQSQKHEGCVDPERWVEVEQISEASIACRPRRHQEGRARRSPHGPSRLSSPLASYPGPHPRNRLRPSGTRSAGKQGQTRREPPPNLFPMEHRCGGARQHRDNPWLRHAGAGP